MLGETQESAAGFRVFGEGGLGQPREGDLLLIESVGAYNLIASNEWAGDRAEVVEA